MTQGISRHGVDTHIGHASPKPDPFHQTPYISSGQDSVYVNGQLAIVVGDKTACGDPAVEGSSKVFINNKAVHRIGDGTGGHDPWVPNAAATGSNNVKAG